MKRLLVILILILVGVFVILSFWDNSDYALEKSFWYLQKDFVKLAHDPKSFPEQEFASQLMQFKFRFKVGETRA